MLSPIIQGQQNEKRASNRPLLDLETNSALWSRRDGLRLRESGEHASRVPVDNRDLVLFRQEVERVDDRQQVVRRAADVDLARVVALLADGAAGARGLGAEAGVGNA